MQRVAVQLGLPAVGIARAGVAQRRGARGHAGAELVGEGGDHRIGHAQGLHPGGGHGDVQRGFGLALGPRLRGRHARQQASQPGPPGVRVVDAEEEVGGVRVGVAVRAHDVALQVGEVEGRGGHGQPPTCSRNAAFSCAGSIAWALRAKAITASRCASASRTCATVACG